MEREKNNREFFLEMKLCREKLYDVGARVEVEVNETEREVRVRGIEGGVEVIQREKQGVVNNAHNSAIS